MAERQALLSWRAKKKPTHPIRLRFAPNGLFLTLSSRRREDLPQLRSTRDVRLSASPELAFAGGRELEFRFREGFHARQLRLPRPDVPAIMGQLPSPQGNPHASQAPQGITLIPTQVPTFHLSSSAGTANRISGLLEAAAKTKSAIQKTLLGLPIAQNGRISAHFPDVSAQDAKLEGCLKRIGELEKKDEAAEKGHEGHRTARDFISFEVNSFWMLRRKEAEEPLKEVKKKEKSTPEQADLQPSRVSIPSHLRYQGEKKTVLDPQGSRANVLGDSRSASWC
ncbi:hypothetical protein BU16DRAFT_554177 [Lophium mytilinum]|uniref:Uncharacterized protein n=1 Tax=Lophium mytilinum TaxID=390894 RepID=A0A6A6RF69_9PEZI|nr:hypothetical protein BU16DRAFT_554177 [Lophium mytilinum]